MNTYNVAPWSSCLSPNDERYTYDLHILVVVIHILVLVIHILVIVIHILVVVIHILYNV